VGNGAVIWVEQYLPSALVAIMVSSSPLWFVLLDKSQWKENFSNRSTMLGLLIGFIGVFLLFYKSIIGSLSGEGSVEVGGMLIVTIAAISWSGGSLYSKYNSKGTPAIVNSTWQMLAAGIAFTIGSLFRNEFEVFDVNSVTTEAWWSVAYLILFGSIAGFSAYVWLLEVKPATQVSTYAYVNPVVAVLLGVFFANESITPLQIIGLSIILLSVMLINFAKYRKSKIKDA
jgi:drug/metabolite transporter (DMT)-like permease